MSDIIVIESPNKKETFLKNWPDKDIVICATLGYLLVPNESLDPLEIDHQFRDTRYIRIEKTIEYMLFELSRNDGDIYLCTDADNEGEVIAQDYAALAAQNGYGDRRAFRVLCKGLDADSIRNAVASAKQKEYTLNDMVDCYPAAAAGHARRITDRLFAGTFGTPDAPVGRVIAGFLDAVSKGVQPATSKAPPHMGDLLIDPSLLDLSVSEVSKGLQTLYERGVMSYPRTAGRTLSEYEQRTLAALSRRAGTQTPHYSETESDEPHHALHPLGDIARMRDIVDRTLFPPAGLNATDRVENAVYAKLLGINQHSNRQVNIPDSHLVERYVVGVLLTSGLGKPSSWPSFAEKMAEWDVVDPNGEFTYKGTKIHSAQPDFMTKEMAQHIEQILLKGGVFPDEIIRAILKEFPDSALEKIETAISKDAGHTTTPEKQKTVQKEDVKPVGIKPEGTTSEKPKDKESVRKRLRLEF
jgi:hypothetical protein